MYRLKNILSPVQQSLVTLIKICLIGEVPYERPSKIYLFIVLDRFIRAFIRQRRHTLKPFVLDAACQTGWHITYLFPLEKIRYFGIDVDQSAVDKCLISHKSLEFESVDLDSSEMAKLNNMFELVVSSNTLDYIPFERLSFVVNNLIKCVVAGGSLALSINKSSLLIDNQLVINDVISKVTAAFYHVRIQSYSTQASKKYEANYSDNRGYYIGAKTLAARAGWLLMLISQCFSSQTNTHGVILLCKNKK